MPDNMTPDTQLASYVEKMLAGEPVPEIDDRDGLVSIIQQLHAIIEPEQEPPAPFRDRLRQRLVMEWNLQYQRRTRRWSWPVSRLATVAAGVAVVLAVVVLLDARGDANERLQGAASGPAFSVVLVIVGLALMGAVLMWWHRRS